MTDFKAEGGAPVAPPTVAGLGMWARYAVEVKDPTGKVVETREGASHSFTRWYGRFVREMLSVANTTYDSYTDLSGTTRYYPLKDTGVASGMASGFTESTAYTIAAVADILMGSGFTAPVSTDNKLEGPFLSGKIACTTTLLQEDASGYMWKHEGSMIASGGNLTVNELGLAFHLRAGPGASGATGSQNWTMLAMRDVVGALGSGVVVSGGNTVTGRYTFLVSV